MKTKPNTKKNISRKLVLNLIWASILMLTAVWWYVAPFELSLNGFNQMIIAQFIIMVSFTYWCMSWILWAYEMEIHDLKARHAETLMSEASQKRQAQIWKANFVKMKNKLNQAQATTDK